MTGYRIVDSILYITSHDIMNNIEYIIMKRGARDIKMAIYKAALLNIVMFYSVLTQTGKAMISLYSSIICKFKYPSKN